MTTTSLTGGLGGCGVRESQTFQIERKMNLARRFLGDAATEQMLATIRGRLEKNIAPELRGFLYLITASHAAAPLCGCTSI